ncbi:helix-turn-helix domain-containing protein [Viridibacillus arvi]|uniref:helix-turn-helix domain-containing protein n=1 Tax=Viridibacillus arvi TaxID=263475 RepID=UPI0034CDD39B
MESLGAQIKGYRKRLKLTLKQLAGDDLSYSMLSQIENDKAQPSLAMLQLLAKKLSVEISELMGGAELTNLRSILKEAEALSFSTYERDKSNDIKVISLIEPILPSLVDINYETARLLDLYSQSYFHIYNNLEDGYLLSAIQKYEQLNMGSYVVRASLDLSKRYFQRLDYEQAYIVLQNVEEKLEDIEIHLDLLTKWEVCSYAAAIHFAIGNVPKGKQYLEDCIHLSEANNLYYQIDKIYQLIIIQALQENDIETGNLYIAKLALYVQFTQNIYVKSYAMYLECHYRNCLLGDYEEVLRRINSYRLEVAKEFGEMTLTVLFDYEQAYSLWGLERYEDALKILKNLSIPDYVKHPYDLSACYQTYAIRALCNFHIGNKEDAFEDIIFSHQNIKRMPATHYKSFIETSYKKILQHNI